MSIELFAIKTRPPTVRERMRARSALLRTARLAKSSPAKIEKKLTAWSYLPPATYEQAESDRNAICAISARCRGQEGCLPRSLAVAAAAKSRGRSVDWCTGFCPKPFRAHAWVEVSGKAVGELEEVSQFEVTMAVRSQHIDHLPLSVLETKEDKSSPAVERSSPASLRQLFSLAREEKESFFLVLLLGVLGTVLTLSVPWMTSKVLEGGSYKRIPWALTAVLLVLVCASGIVAAFQQYLLQRIGEHVVRVARERLSERLLSLSISEYDSRSTGDLISRFSNDTGKLRLAVLQLTIACTHGIVMLIGASAIMFYIAPTLFAFSAILIAVTLGITVISASFITSAAFSAQESLGVLSSNMEDSIRAVRTLRSYNAIGNFSTKINYLIERNYRAALRVARMQAIVSPISNVGLQVCGLLIIGAGVFEVKNNYISITHLTQFILLLFILIAPLTQMISATTEFGESVASLSRINEILELPDEDEVDLPVINEPEIFSSAAVSVEFANVYFSYEKRAFGDPFNLSVADGVLHGFNLSVPPGVSVALVGPSGAGKSTVLSLLERFYETDHGAISINGVNITDISRSDLRNKICYVEQDSPVIHGTLRENLILGDTCVSDDECIRILNKLNLGHLVTRSGLGLDVQLGEDGANISGGERQRIATARAFLSKRPLVLLDEATANLDAVNEKIIYDLFREEGKGRTIIMVAHRLASVINSDVICVLEHGRLVGQGSHEYLIKNIPLYRSLATEQGLVSVN